MHELILRIQQAIENNHGCSAGVMCQNFVIASPQGYARKPELLAFLAYDVSCCGYWYAHTVWYAEKDCYASLLVWAGVMVNAEENDLLLRRFNHWMRERLSYQPCMVQNADDAYAEAPSFHEAVNRLETIVQRFDLSKRWGSEDHGYEESPGEFRILSVYGFGNLKDATAHYPPVPTRTSLKLVGGSDLA